MTLGNRIAQARTAHQLTQQQLADSLHVSRKTISSWETGRSYPDVASLVALSDLLQLSTDSLLKGDAAVLAEYQRRDRVLARVRHLGWAALGINVLLTIGFCASTRQWHGFVLGQWWEVIAILVMLVNFYVLYASQRWQLQLKGASPLVKALQPWIYGVILGGVLFGAVFVGCVVLFHWPWWSLLVWMVLYWLGAMGAFYWYAKRHQLFSRFGKRQ